MASDELNGGYGGLPMHHIRDGQEELDVI